MAVYRYTLVMSSDVLGSNAGPGPDDRIEC